MTVVWVVEKGIKWMERKKEATSKRTKVLTKPGRVLIKPIKVLPKGKGKVPALRRRLGQLDQSFITVHIKSLD